MWILTGGQFQRSSFSSSLGFPLLDHLSDPLHLNMLLIFFIFVFNLNLSISKFFRSGFQESAISRGEVREKGSRDDGDCCFNQMWPIGDKTWVNFSNEYVQCEPFFRMSM